MREMGFIAAARLIVIFCQFVNIKLFTNHLSAEQLGYYFFLLTVSFFANALIFGPVDYYQQANLSRIMKLSGGCGPLLQFNIRLCGVYLALAALALLVALVVAPAYTLHVALTALLALALYLVQALRNTLNNLGHKTLVSASLVLEATVKILIFLAVMQLVAPNALLLLSVWLVTLALTAIPLAIFAAKQGVFRSALACRVAARDVFHFAVPMSVGAVCNWIQLQGYRLVLVPLGFAGVVGEFSAISAIGSGGMAAAATIFSQAYSPLIYKSEGAYTAKYLRNAALLILVVGVTGWLFSDLIVKLTTNPEFEKHSGLLLFGVLADASNLIIGALAINLTLTGDTRKIMISSMLGLVALAFSFALIFGGGAISVTTIGIPLIFSQAIVIIYLYWNFRKCSTN